MLFVSVPRNGSPMPVVYLPQNGPHLYSLIPFGDRNIAQGGCSAACLAMVISYLNSGSSKAGWISPGQIVRKIRERYGSGNHFYCKGVGQYWAIFPAVADLYGLRCEDVPLDGIPALLRSGVPVIMSCSKGIFTNGGHFIVLTGITPDGRLYVNDPTYSHRHFSYQTFPFGDVAPQWKHSWALYKQP